MVFVSDLMSVHWVAAQQANGTEFSLCQALWSRCSSLPFMHVFCKTATRASVPRSTRVGRSLGFPGNRRLNKGPICAKMRHLLPRPVPQEKQVHLDGFGSTLSAIGSRLPLTTLSGEKESLGLLLPFQGVNSRQGSAKRVNCNNSLC